MSAPHALGWLRPPHAHEGRRLGYAREEAILAADAVDLRSTAPGVVQQRGLGSCVGQATRYGTAALFARDGLDVVPSALACYWDARAAVHRTGVDDGAMIADALRAAEQGLVDEGAWPDLDANVLLPPSDAARRAASHTRLIDWQPLGHDAGSILWTLKLGLPVLIGIEVFPPLDDVGDDGRVAMPTRGQRSRGGHALCVLGYDARAAADVRLIVRGSWGRDYADHGDLYLPLDWALDPYLCGEIHALHAVRQAR